MNNKSISQLTIVIRPFQKIGFLAFIYIIKPSNSNPEILITSNRLSVNDFDRVIIKENPWAKQLIKLCSELSFEILNKKINPKSAKIDFLDFIKTADEKIIKHLRNIVDIKMISILNMIRKYNIPVFINDRHEKQYNISDSIYYSKNKAIAKFSFTKNEKQLEYRLKVLYKDSFIDIRNKNIHIITNNQAHIIYNNEIISFKNDAFNGNKLLPFLKKEIISVNTKMEGMFFKSFIKPAVKMFDCEIKGFDFKELNVDTKAILLIEETFNGHIIVTVVFEYANHSIAFYKKQDSFIDIIEQKGQYSLSRIKRDYKFEIDLSSKLQELGFKQKSKYFHLEGLNNKHAFTEFFVSIAPKIKELGFSIENRLFNDVVQNILPSISYKSTQNTDWFDLHIIIHFGEFKIPFISLKNNILEKKQEYKLPNGEIAIIPHSWFSEFYSFAIRTNGNNSTHIYKAEIQLIDSSKVIFPNSILSKEIEKLDINKSLKLPKKSIAKLRDYQKSGYYWLHQLTSNNYGVCLADDMGLGKTLQVITLLQKHYEDKSIATISNQKKEVLANQQLSIFDIIDNNEASHGTEKVLVSSLIIVPKSIVHNWVKELEKFTPELTYFIYQSTNRQDSLTNNIDKVNVIITTYGIMRSDIDFLETFSFNYIIADESQAIKNPTSKTHKAILRLQSEHNISITGTPIENNLMDIWSQMNFVNNGILGNKRYFEKAYMQQTDMASREIQLQELKTIISPFILRRLKKDVAKDLPDKIEQIIYCEMENTQSDLYEMEKSSIRNLILFGKGAKKTKYMDALSKLTRLRQIAIHPALVKKNQDYTSGKFSAIIDTINNLIDQNHKFLIFSSFVEHLKLIQNYFKENSIPYSMLTGKDNKRQQIVDNYETNNKIKPFLISIKAGGVGLNLTSANYVLLIDPWWNPFVEQQAIDRTHRIGQDKNVVVYKFISRNTVEEKMIELQKRKLEMSNSLINYNTETSIKMEEIINLVIDN